MTDVYKIAVNLAMSSNAPAFLSALTNQLHIAHVKTKELEGGLKSLDRVKLAVGGALAVTAGVGLLGFLKHGIESTKELSHELTQLQKLNIGPQRLAQVRSAAVAATQQVPGVNEIEALKVYGSAYGIFGHENALKLIKPLSEFAQVAGNTSGNYEKAADSIYQMIRAGDLMGKFVNESTHNVDIGKLQHFLDLGAKVILGTHGKIDANAWLQLAQQGGPALSGMSDQGLLTMAIAAQAMGGPRAGTALTSLYQQMVGGKMTAPVAGKLRELGLVGDFDVGRGGHIAFHKGALDNDFTRSLKNDPIHAVEIMKKALETHGFDNIEKQVPQLFEILGRQTTQRLVHDLLRNLPQILTERQRIAGSQGVGEAKKTQDANDIEQAEHNLEQAWMNLKLAFFGPDSGAYISILNLLTGGINKLTGALREAKPESIEAIGKGIAAIGLGLTGAGGAALIAAMGPVGWIAGGIVALTAAVVAFKPEWITVIVNSLGTLWDALKGWWQKFGDWVKSKQLPGNPGFDPNDNIGALPQSFSGDNAGLLHQIGYAPSGTANDNSTSIGLIALGTREGFLAALQQASGGSGALGMSGGGGLINASFGGGGGVRGFFSGSALAVGAGSGIGHAASQAERAAYIRSTAASLGIDPEVALRVAQSEGFYQYTGDRGTSFGDFQMHVGGGLGDIAMRMGIDPRNPNNWKALDKLALTIAARKHSWADWHGAAHVGIAPGRGFGLPPTASAPPRKPTETHIHELHVDGKRMASVVTKHRVADGQFPTSAGGPDTHGHFTNPGTPINDAA